MRNPHDITRLQRLRRAKSGVVWIPILIMVVAVAAFATTAIVIYRANQTEPSTTVNTAVTNNANTDSPAGNTNTAATNTNMAADANSTSNLPGATADWQTYTNENLGIQFEYPKSWGATEQNLYGSKEAGEGEGVRVQFAGTTKVSFGKSAEVLYSTADYAPGREVWLGEILSEVDKTIGLGNICTAKGTTKLFLNWVKNIRNCSVEKVNGKWQATFSTQIDSLDGSEVFYLVNVFAFQTKNTTYPVGALAIFFPELADPNATKTIPVNDTKTLDGIYRSIAEKAADPETNASLREFDHAVSTFQFTN